MDISFSVFDFIILFGITQGLITSSLLLFSSEKSLSNKLLAFGIISFCILSAKIVIYNMNLWNISYIRYFPLGIDLAIQPLIYFYAISLIKSKIYSKYILTFIPFFIFMLYSIFVYSQVIGVEQLALKDKIASGLYFSEVKKAEDYISLISIFIYIYFGYFELKKFKKSVQFGTKNQSDTKSKWLLTIIRFMLTLGVFTLINLILKFIFPESSFFRWQLFYIYLSFVIYYIGFRGLKMSYIIPNNRQRRNALSMSESEIESLITRFEKLLIEDQLYLDSKLNIKLFSKHMDINPRTLTAIFSHRYKMSFKDFINRHRVEEVKRKFNDRSTDNLTILGIALDSGFNSEASFYRIFKKFTGLAPKEFQIQQNRKSN